MKYFLDTEFIEAGPSKPIQLISIGIVAEDLRQLYRISAEFNPADANPWVKENVLAKLEDYERGTLAQIADDVSRFCDPAQYGKPEFWGYYADYDWVVAAQMFGRMIDLPKGWPMYCRDIKQLAVELGDPKLPEQGKGEHNALADAQWNKVAYDFLMAKTADFRIIGKDSGVARITDERLRQIKEEGWTPEHDDQHTLAELAIAGLSYASVAASQIRLRDGCLKGVLPTYWPWAKEWWKPSDDPIRNLEKAGALIAAEIDRLKRKADHGS